MSNSKFSTKQLVFCAMALALATVISVVIKLPSLPYGGSVTFFSMLIICLVGYWYGPTVGLITAVAYGVLQFITGPYFLHPIQVLLDYPLAFGALGLSGFFSNKKHGLMYGYIAGVAGRFLFHEISGFIFYTEYVGDAHGNLLAMIASTTYNLSYLLPEMIATVILLAIPPVANALAKVKTMAVAE